MEDIMRSLDLDVEYPADDKDFSGMIGKLVKWLKQKDMSDKDIVECIQYICE